MDKIIIYVLLTTYEIILFNLMHKIELYGYGESVASNMARVALSEKNISYKYNLLYLESKGDHLSKKYKKLNPKNLVPTMIDNGNVIPDSIQIMRHINSTYADGTDLFPENINQDIFNNLLDFVKLDEKKELGETLGTTAGGISATILVRLLCKRSLLSVIWDYSTKHSIKKRIPIFILLRILGKPPEKLSKKMALALSKHLVYIEDILKHEKPFMMGDQYTAIDSCMTSILHRINEMRFTNLLTNENLPNIAKYWKIIQARPSYKEGILDYVTGEWEIEIQSLYGNGSNKYEDLALSEITRLLKEK
ncbi:glutathione S-transferase N-terminal domain-containing protein [Gammaproteobacteria bacterium]|nr:glutathione S-transferase N-terminal domain-containing protein [Gammaproteobacteria bacterium]MDA8674586.1 glutathione S-transferase N-terminal domain-containing protein [Gammaproteobacteria bacterium]MDA8683090.1 glutathione S-transferase N-terminal domain-containing protein [Gammaproteobacteria bacterium]MDA8908207.1 glutathione S-transferase N-terminal domain-containing protein [Gammaproteobacteria bacterium]MDB3915755.1 glutathione S-transferase N-terminal domain-containing protein [Gamm